MKERIVMLCGGVGGARAALALYENIPTERLTFLVNTGDDFQHLGLEIWPDWDTVVYHLAGLQNSDQGWGRSDEGQRAMEELERLGAPTWFQLGDRDLALHLYRSWRLGQGHSSSQVCREITRGFGVRATTLALTVGGLNTKLLLQDGRTMDFQDWFVRERGEPEVKEVINRGASDLALAEGVEEALRECDCLLFAPSNPYLSLGPMLQHNGFADLLRNLSVRKLAISPLIGGRAVKGPLDRLIGALSPFRGQQAMAHYWAPWADGLLLPSDEIDGVEDSPLPLYGCPTRLKTRPERARFVERLQQIWQGKP